MSNPRWMPFETSISSAYAVRKVNSVVAESFNREKAIMHDAAAQLIAYPFEPEMEAYLWEQQDWDMKRVPTAIVAPNDISFVLGALGEPAELKWSIRVINKVHQVVFIQFPASCLALTRSGSVTGTSKITFPRNCLRGPAIIHMKSMSP